MRPSPAQAKAKVNEYIAFLEENGVPTALFKERVKGHCRLGSICAVAQAKSRGTEEP
jgi:hypothetical protein